MPSAHKTNEIITEYKIQFEADKKADKYPFELFINGYTTNLDALTTQIGVCYIDLLVTFLQFEEISTRIELYCALGGSMK